MKTAFLIERLVWVYGDWSGHLETDFLGQTFLEPEGEQHEHRVHPESLFEDRETAVLAMERLESRERENRSVFRLVETWAEIEIDAGRLVERGIVAPVRDSDSNTDQQLLDLWWDEQSPTWTEEQREFVWSLFPQVRFYAIREIPFED